MVELSIALFFLHWNKHKEKFEKYKSTLVTMQNCSGFTIESYIPKDMIISVFCNQKSAFQRDINK